MLHKRYSLTKLYLSLLIAGYAAVIFPQYVLATAGEPDLTFGFGGSITSYFGAHLWIGKVLVQTDGRIIVVGTKQTPDDRVVVRRFTSDGVLEQDFAGSPFGTAFDAEVQPDGKVVVLGNAPHWVSSSTGPVYSISPVVWRFNLNGTLDQTFGTGGARFINTVAVDSHLSQIEIYNGKTIIAYSSFTPHIRSITYKVTRLSSSGAVDFTLVMPFNFVDVEKVFSIKVSSSNGDILAIGPKPVTKDAVIRSYTIAGG